MAMDPRTVIDVDRFVGRAGELAALNGLVTAASAGEPAFGLVSGPAGIGKTRLLAAFAQEAAGRGWTVVRVTAPQLDGAPAFWPWRELLRTWPGPDLAEALATHGSYLTRILASGTAHGPVDGEERFVAFTRFAELLGAAAGVGTVLVLDDLHRCDPASLALFAAVVEQTRTGRLVLVGARRAHETDTAVRAAVARHPRSAVVELGGLSGGEVAVALHGLLQRRPAPDVVAAIHARTRGNPLFVRELGRLLDRAPAELPAAVRDAVEQHLDLLPAPARRTLLTAAVLGSADPDRLSAVTGRSDVLDHLDAAVRIGIMTADGGFAFAHDLFPETLLEQVQPPERAQLHLAAAEALSAAGAASIEIARHRLAALPSGNRELASAVAQAAGEEALAHLAFESASTLFEQALAAAPADLPVARRCALLVDAGRARAVLRDGPGAIERCAEAAELASAAGDVTALARACLALPDVTEPEWIVPLGAWCARALALLPAGDGALRAQLLAQKAVTSLFGSAIELDTSSLAALAMARRLAVDEPGTDQALRIALRARQLARATPDGHAERLLLGADMIDLGRRTGDLDAVFWGHLWRFDARVQAGRTEHALAELEAVAPVVERLGRPLPRWHLIRSRAAMAIGRGMFAEADRLVRLAAEVVPDGLTVAQPYWAGLHVARLTGAAPAIPDDPVPADSEHQIAPVAAFAHVAPWLVAAGRPAEAAALLHALPAPGSPRIPAFLMLLIEGMRCTVAAALGELDAAAAAYEMVLPYADLHVATGAGVSVTMGSAHLPLGVAALACGRTAQATAHLRAAVAANDAAGLHPFTVLARYQLAVALRSRAEAAHAVRAARRLGMAPALAAATDLVAELATAQLTRRQQEIAELVAQGASNRRIASALHLSERTAENHIRNIMATLGVHSRVDIAMWVTQQDGG